MPENVISKFVKAGEEFERLKEKLKGKNPEVIIIGEDPGDIYHPHIERMVIELFEPEYAWIESLYYIRERLEDYIGVVEILSIDKIVEAVKSLGIERDNITLQAVLEGHCLLSFFLLSKYCDEKTFKNIKRVEEIRELSHLYMSQKLYPLIQAMRKTGTKLIEHKIKRNRDLEILSHEERVLRRCLQYHFRLYKSQQLETLKYAVELTQRIIATSRNWIEAYYTILELKTMVLYMYKRNPNPELKRLFAIVSMSEYMIGSSRDLEEALGKAEISMLVSHRSEWESLLEKVREKVEKYRKKKWKEVAKKVAKYVKKRKKDAPIVVIATSDGAYRIARELEKRHINHEIVNLKPIAEEEMRIPGYSLYCYSILFP